MATRANAQLVLMAVAAADATRKGVGELGTDAVALTSDLWRSLTRPASVGIAHLFHQVCLHRVDGDVGLVDVEQVVGDVVGVA